MRGTCFFLLCSVVFLGGITVGEGFVPFVIPAEHNEASLIGAAGDPIEGQADRVTVKEGHFYRADERIRFWGVNLSFAANFPKHEDAVKIARRLAAAGVNSVRFHHMDTARWPRGLWNARDGKDLSQEAMDRLDYFIDQLARNGIYANLNLHVGREHSSYLGLPKAKRNYDKVTNIFTPALVEAQEQFAAEMLGHYNKYRKMTYAEDPAIAIVEITNENSFFMWDGEETLRTLPEYYAKILQVRYNEWLQKKYGSTRKLTAAWGMEAKPLGEDVLVNGDFAEGADGWQLEQHSGSKTKISAESFMGERAVGIGPSEVSGVEWHLQFKQGNVKVKAGEYYTVTFKGAAEKERAVACSVSMAHEPWGNLGLSRKVELGEEWREFRFGFFAKGTDDNARLTFAFGADKAKVYLADVQLLPGGLEGLGEGESISQRSVKLFADSETSQRTIDRMCFLAETEKAYFDGMREYIKADCGSKSLVTGTIVFGPLGMYGQSDMDFLDGHAYWQHPRFPRKPWDRSDWLIDQKSMVDYPQEATLFRLAAERMAGKPYTVTEYNHPAPLDSQAECVPMIASFAAAQDWDGVWLYTYSHSGDDWDREVLSSYFDIDTNPAKWGFMRSGAAIFAEGQIRAFDGMRIRSFHRTENVARDLAEAHLKYDRNMFDAFGNDGEAAGELACRSRIAVTFGESYAGSGGRNETAISWGPSGSEGIYVAVDSGAGVFLGQGSSIKEKTGGRLDVTSPESFSMTLVSLDGAEVIETSGEILMTICGRCENTDMEFSQDRRTVGLAWGKAPVRIEAVEARLELFEARFECKALGPDGAVRYDVPVKHVERRSIIELSPKYETMWYLLTRKK